MRKLLTLLLLLLMMLTSSAMAAEISRVAARASGSRALMRVDFPMPDWPTSTLVLPCSQGRRPSAPARAESSRIG